jgi:hypothetical protein
MGADGAVFAGCVPTVVRLGGTVTTTGAAATAIAAGLLAQGLVPAAPHPAAVVRELAIVPADDGPEENTPRARYRLPPISTASTSAPDAAILARPDDTRGDGVPRFISSPPSRR